MHHNQIAIFDASPTQITIALEKNYIKQINDDQAHEK